MFAVKPGAEGLAFDKRHHVVQQAIGTAGVEERQDVGVLQRRGELDLLEEALAAEHGAEFGAEDLDGDPAAVLHVLGEVDRGHPARTNLPLDAVAIGEGLDQARGCGHFDFRMLPKLRIM